MTSNWLKLGKESESWYRKTDIYTALWSDDPERLQSSVVAGAPNGGPIATVRDEHVFQPVRGSLCPELQTWTSAGRPIASAPWTHQGLIKMGWSSQETLVCVFEQGIVRTFTVRCEQLHVFTIDDRIKSEGGAIDATLWGNGVCVLTRRLSLFVNTSVTRSGDLCHRTADMKVPSPPLALCVLPPPHEDSADVQVIVGTAEGPVLVVDRHEARDIKLDEGPYMAFAVSSNGRLLACLSSKGVFKLIGVFTGFQILDESNLEFKKKPSQMVWCADDCIALYHLVQTPSSTCQHVVFVGGPHGDFIPYQYNSPLLLVPECDGCRIVGTEKVEFVQRVPPSTLAIEGVGSCDPPAMLKYALERFQTGDVLAQESLRLIKADLPEAVSTCIEAALHEHEPEKVKDLLSAAVFGRHFLPEPMDQKAFVEACRNLRICIELRKSPIDMPLTVPQLERIGVAGVTMRLAQRHHHLLAVRICEWVGHPQDKVVFHWACETIRHARGSGRTDEQLCEAILDKFRNCQGVGYAEVARIAAEMYRPFLATMLLNHEPRGHAQVQVLLQLSREGDDENRMMMLKLAAEKAAQSCDPDLLYGIISAACDGDPCSRGTDIGPVVKLVREKPQDLQVLGDMLANTLHRNEEFDRAREFHEKVGHLRQAAHAAVQQVFQMREAEQRSRWLRFSKDLFSQTESGVPDAERVSMQFCAQMSAEESDLLKRQLELEEQSVLKRWIDGPHRFVGLSLVDSVAKLIALGETVEADSLKSQFNFSEKRYWRIKVRALAESKNFQELHMMAKHCTSPIGYELIVEVLLKNNRNDLALPFVDKVKDPGRKAAYYSKMGMEEEAQQARAQLQERSNPGRLLQNFFRLS